MTAPALIPVDHSLKVQHSFDVVSWCRCGGRVYVGRVDQDLHSAETAQVGERLVVSSFMLGLWHAYEPDGTMAGTVSTLTDAIHLLNERASHDPKGNPCPD